MKTLHIATIFGTLSIRLGDPDSTGARPGEIISMLTDPADAQEDAAITAIESVILAHACAGVDVEAPAYVEGINTAIEAVINNA